MAWESILKNRIALKKVGGCVVSVISRAQEVRKGRSSQSSRMQIDALTMDKLRLKLRDKVAWVVDKERKAIAFVLDANGTSSITPGRGKKLSMHVPKEISEFMRLMWGVGCADHAHTFSVELILSGGYIEIKRKGE